tara:strand:+ start:1157 stop:2044 length:888 start_codon:yes stop_codon:yes gene_type:complete
MGIYVRKRKKNLLKVLIFISLIFFLIISTYYLFFPSSYKDITNNLENYNNENLNQIEKKPEIILGPTKIIDIDLSEYLKKNELDQSIKNFIKNNPDFLLETLREYQKKINELEQEKITMQNNSNIQNLNLNLDAHSMFIGNKNSTKIIFEFVDYNCGYCIDFHNEVMSIISKDPSIKLVIIQMPILGKMSEELSKLALASSLQGKFKEVHNYLYSPKRKLQMDDILADLFLLNINLPQLEKDLGSEIINKISNNHQSIADNFKFSGTPAIIIGSTIIPGFIKEDKISEILEKEFY